MAYFSKKINNIRDAFLTKICYACIMKRFGIKTLNFILTFLLAVFVFAPLVGDGMPVYASAIKDKEEEIEEWENIIEGIEDEIESYTGEQDILLEQIDDLNAEIINVLASIGLLEEQITGKEADIAVKQQEYEVAKQIQEEQEIAMAQRIKLSYETGGTESIISRILSSLSFAQLLNRAIYAESVIDYDSKMLKQYEQTKKEVHDMWDQLEAEKVALEADKAALEEQEAYCEELKAELQQKADDYDALIAAAEQEAKNAKAELKKEQKALEKLKEEERRRQEEARRQEALNKTYETTDYTKVVDGATGSDEGKKIAKYGLQYIGNKYVYGGTSLTNGIDCSGFTMRVYEAFGYDLPRTSYLQRSAGREVSYADAQPGDLICYSGHVGIYMGGGYIVHASNSKPYPQGGIKVNKATYRTILSVRRIIE